MVIRPGGCETQFFVIRLGKQSAEIVLTEVSDDLFAAVFGQTLADQPIFITSPKHYQHIDADLFSTVGHLSIAPEQVDPVLAVGFDEFRKARIMDKSRVEEVGVRRYTYFFFFEFGDDLAREIVLGVVVLAVLILLFVEAEGERIGGFVVSVESVDEILPQTVSPSA